MSNDKLTYLVIENAPDVCEGVIRRMRTFGNWESLGYCTGVKEALLKISDHHPNLLFLDWSLNGGSAYEILQSVQNIPGYNPYIIFNTGFQRDNPEIPQEIFNKYRVDKYLIKPLWENLRKNLTVYLGEAEEKALARSVKDQTVWVEDDNRNKVLIDLKKIACICQHPSEQRSRIIYLANSPDVISIPLQWKKCYDLLNANRIDFFITKTRSHLVVKEYVQKFEKPFVRLKGINAFKIDVVREKINEFEAWLTQ